MLNTGEVLPFIVAAVLTVTAAQIGADQSARPAQSGLRIVVVEGEDAVNVVQQKTAVAPVVEVRDRNDQPVGGVIVRFAIRNGRATFSGARNLSVVTNAAGRAAASGLVPTGNGALQISATAAFQGQTAAITIAQTNVMTLAEAATVSGAGASGGGAGAGTGTGGAAGGGTGGGFSATTVGVVGGAAAGGAIAAKELGLIGGPTKYSGQFGGTLAMVFTGCTRNEVQSGTIEIEINEGSGALDGSANVHGDVRIGQPNPCGPPGYTTDSFGVSRAPLAGSTANMTFRDGGMNRYTDPDGTSGLNAYLFTFAGAQNGAEITGTLTVTRTITNDKGPIPGVGSITYNVTLR